MATHKATSLTANITLQLALTFLLPFWTVQHIATCQPYAFR